MISSEHPFVPREEDRDPNRRFRGRLPGPVTIVTAGSGAFRTGLTVSSLFVIEGDPGVVSLAVGPITDLWSALTETGRFVVHVARPEHQPMADVFAGARPSPGGIFAGVKTADSDWGPVLADLPDRAFCHVVEMREEGWSGVVDGAIDRVEVTDLTDPLIHFRGAYRRLR